MSVVTRFAPSPTGMLHIGSARTALFNYLFSKKHNGKFLLRIEDTDKERSTEEAKAEIINSLKWLGIDHDGEIVMQSEREARHRKVAYKLVELGQAYFCYASKEELDALRLEASKKNQVFKYDGRWRDRDPKDAPKDVKPVIRIKAPTTGKTIINDHVMGEVVFDNSEIDDLVILRSDGTPTYMLAVVVDDHDMDITHIIRGSDHLTNAGRQAIIYQAMGWKIPEFSHIPLIHGMDGAKLSKRHGAMGTSEYKKMGYLPEAINNYLLRLGWSHGDDEIISREQAINWFNLENIGKSASRFDFKKLDNLNGHYIRNKNNNDLIADITPLIEEKINKKLEQTDLLLLSKAINSLKERAKNINELVDSALFYFVDDLDLTDKAKQILDSDDNQKYLLQIIDFVKNIDDADFSEEKLNELSGVFIEKIGLSMKDFAQIIRSKITFSHISPSIFEVMMLLGKTRTLKRLESN